MSDSAHREHWRSRLGIFFATSGSAIGLGTLWKLPYLVGQGGGGAFILLFLIFTLLLGMPLFMAELILGKTYQQSVVKVFSAIETKTDTMAFFGFLALVVTILIAGWYGVVAGWGLNYLFMSLTDAFAHKTAQDFAAVFEQFRKAGSINLLWQAVFVGITCIILIKGVRGGIEKFSKVFFSLLFLLIISLFIYATFLSGFEEAVEYLLYPDFSKLDQETVLAALGLSLFALSLGQGIMVTYGSYLTHEQDIFRTALVVSLSVVAISVIISLMIFPMIFTFGFPPESGEGLLFITMPYVTEQLPGSMLISALFFMLLIFAALTSYMGQLEVLVASIMEMFSLSRFRSTIIAGALAFLMGVPTALMMSDKNPFADFSLIFHRSFLQVNYIVIDWILMLFALGVCVAVGFKLSNKQLATALNRPLNSMLLLSFKISIRYMVPFFILLVALKRFGVC